MRLTVFWAHRPLGVHRVHARRIPAVLRALALDGGSIDAVFGQSTQPLEVGAPMDPDLMPVLYATQDGRDLLVHRWPLGDGLGRSKPDADEWRRLFYDLVYALDLDADYVRHLLTA